MALWKDKTRKGWRYAFQFRGKKYTSNYYPTKAEASAAMAEAKKEAAKLPSTEELTETVLDFVEVANLYLDFSERRHVKQTFEYKRMVLKNFAALYGTISITEIQPQHILNYLTSRRSNHNFNAHRKELFCLFHYAQKVLKVVVFNPCEDIQRLPHTPGRKVMPSENDVLKLIVAADPGDEKDLVMVLLYTLARIDEILRLRWEDVNFDQRVVTLWTRKRKDGNLESDAMPMNKDLYDVLWRRWESRKQNDWVFHNEKTNSRYNRRPKFMRGLCKRAGIPYIGFHSIRHFMASFLADKQKISLMTISKLLRHRSLNTTEIYLHSIGEGQRAAMDGIEGVFSASGFASGSELISTRNSQDGVIQI